MSKKAWIKKPKVAIVMSTTANLQVLYEDNHLIAVNKRNSDIVQGDHTGDTNLGEVVRQYIKDKYNKPGKTFTGTIHRLDRPVSGVIIYARTTKGLNRMMNVFKHREIQKTYWAVVRNQPPKMEGTVVNYLIKNEKINKSFAHNHPADGRKESELSYTVL
ncbi:MAG: pseudouridine synthase, partial [Flavobacteriales bacterium]